MTDVHVDFADWLRPTRITLSPDTVTRRWNGVKAFSRDSGADDLPELTRVAYKLKPNSVDFLEELRQPFKTADESFSMRDNDAELSVLASAVLVDLIELEGDWGAAAALAAACAGSVTDRSAGISDLPVRAERHLRESAAGLRTSMDTTLSDATAVTKLITAVSTASGQSWPEAGPMLGKVLSEALTAINSCKREATLRREESQMLWWLMGGQCKSLDKPWSGVDREVAALLVAEELATMTEILPGPYAVSALIASVIDRTPATNKKTNSSYSDFIGKCLKERPVARTSLAVSDSLGDLFPVHGAIHAYLRADGKKAWQADFSRMTGMKVNEVVDAVAIAKLYYREILFGRAFESLGGGE